MKRMIHIILVLLLAAAACTQDPSRIKEGESFEMTFSFAGAGMAYQSRALAEENHVSDVRVLVFENGIYRYTAFGTNIINAVASVTFSATFRSTSAPVRLYVIANAGDAFASDPPAPGDSEAEVSARLVSPFTAAGITADFGMFGSYDLPGGLSLSVGSLSGIVMMRDIARIDVAVTAENFQLASVQAFRANNLIQVIPNSSNSNIPVTFPSIPAESEPIINTIPVAASGVLSQFQLYLPESAGVPEEERVSGATCVVVGGYFNGSPIPTYYRMDFNPAIAGYPFGQILRNQHYVFTISDVTLPGFATPEDAANSYPVGFTATVVPWSDNTTEFEFGDDQFFGVSSRTATLSLAAGDTAEITVTTNARIYDIQWADALGAGDGNPSTTSINNGTFMVEILDGGGRLRFIALTANTTGADITQNVLITAGRLRILLTIVQRAVPALAVTPQSFVVSPSGGSGYLLVTSSSPWGLISNSSWMSGRAVADSLIWTAQNNPVGQPARSGAFLLTNFDGEEILVPYTQPAANPTTLRIHSIRSYIGYLGAGSSVATAELRAQGLKGILTNGANFGLTGRVHFGGFVFTDNTVMNVADTTNLDIFYSPAILAQSVISPAQAQAIRQWLGSKPDRVLVICFDEQLRNQNLLDAFGVTNLIYPGVAGAFPLQFTPATLPFTTTGPFTVYPSQPLPPFSFRNYDTLHGEIVAASYPNITPILLGPSGGIVLGVDYTTRVVYVGDVDLFSNLEGFGATPDNHILNITGVVNNSASKLIANLWGWIARTALGEI